MNDQIKNNSKTQLLGFTLIELMVAMVIGLIVLLGLVSVFNNSSILNKSQAGLATLQENGRYVISRLREDIELAGRKHCATLTVPDNDNYFTDWDQGYSLTSWTIDGNVNFATNNSTDGLPRINQIQLDLTADPDQLPDAFNTAGLTEYPLDPRYFIRGHECGLTACQPTITSVGSDASSNLRTIGTANGNRAANTDILTVRYLTGGNRVTNQVNNVFTLANPESPSLNLALVADCRASYVSNATWNINNVTLNAVGNIPELDTLSDARAYDLTRDFHTVSYFVGIDSDPNSPGRMISSLFRAENGNVEPLVEGVERFDVFYLAQTQTGHVVRLTANQVQSVQGGGDVNLDDAVDSIIGCITQPKAETPNGTKLANGPGCLWRSIYAIEVHMLLNTVNDSTMMEDEVFIYTPDGLSVQTPNTTLPSGLNRERMYRREFTAIIPIRSYTL